MALEDRENKLLLSVRVDNGRVVLIEGWTHTPADVRELVAALGDALEEIEGDIGATECPFCQV